MDPGSAARRNSASKTRVNALMALRYIRGTLTAASAADIGADDLAEQVPLLAVEFHQLKLADRREIIRTGVDLDAGQQDFGPEILQVSRLLHDVFAGEIVAAHLKHLHQGLRNAKTNHDRGVELVAFGKILLQEGQKFLHAGIVVPLRIGSILQIGGGDNALRILKARRLDDAADRRRNVVEDVAP